MDTLLNNCFNIVSEYLECSFDEDKIIIPIFDNMSIEVSHNVGTYKARLLNINLPTLNISRAIAFDSDKQPIELIGRIIEKLQNIDSFFANVVLKSRQVRAKEVWLTVDLQHPNGKISKRKFVKQSELKRLVKAGFSYEYTNSTHFDRMKVRGKANKKARAGIYTGIIRPKTFV